MVHKVIQANLLELLQVLQVNLGDVQDLVDHVEETMHLQVHTDLLKLQDLDLNNPVIQVEVQANNNQVIQALQARSVEAL